MHKQVLSEYEIQLVLCQIHNFLAEFFKFHTTWPKINYVVIADDCQHDSTTNHYTKYLAIIAQIPTTLYTVNGAS